MIPGERVLSEDMGGEVATVLRMLRDTRFACLGAPRPDLGLDLDHPVDVGDVLGYPHDDGTPDGSGKRWWMYVRCVCGYETAAWKIVRRVREGMVLPMLPLPDLGA